MYLAITNQMGGVLVNLCDRYRAEPKDVLHALDAALRRPLSNESPIEEIAGRIRNQLFSKGRSEARFGLLLQSYQAHPKDGGYALSYEDRQDLAHAVAQLSTSDQALLGAFFMEGKTALEIAQEQGKTEDAIKKAKTRALARLRTLLEKNTK